jgi:hypothetical protein
MPPANPWSRSELVQALAHVEALVHDFFSTLDPDEYILRVDSAWTPAEHLEHLNIAVQAVARGLQISPWLLRLRFGPVRHASRTYEEIREHYTAVLAGGGGARGKFVPPRQTIAPGEVQAHRAGTLARWERRNARFRAALDGWTETQLDRVQLPHPLLGKLTVREMVFFTLYHNQHHIKAAQSRLQRFVKPAV